MGAGTVEFLVDDSGFYFLEMNTRLQVEFAVTEARFGLDLVQWQLRVAQGEHLPATLPSPEGAAIEVRLCAENPSAGFAPQTGVIHTLHLPKGVRCEVGIAQGSEISVFYDPMFAKLIAHAPTRELGPSQSDTGPEADSDSGCRHQPRLAAAASSRLLSSWQEKYTHRPWMPGRARSSTPVPSQALYTGPWPHWP